MSAFLRIGVILSLTLISVAGCGRPSPEVAGAAGAGSGSNGSGSLTIKGSDTMVHLVSQWAEAYNDAHADASVSVTGGGSGTGITALVNGTTDLCMSSRDLSAEERTAAEAGGKEIVEQTVALDGIAIIVNPANPVTHLSLAQLKDIYTGAVTRWSEVGGPDEKIAVVSRESSSGTYIFFQEHVLEKQDYAANARLLPANSTIVQTVADETWAVGYVGLGYADHAKDRVKALPIGETLDTAVAPSVENVLNNSYPIARALHLYYIAPGSDELKRFIDYCMSEAGQAVVRDEGYVPAPGAGVAPDAVTMAEPDAQAAADAGSDTTN